MLNSNDFMKMMAGASKIAGNAKDASLEQMRSFFEDNILKGKYVTREEYTQLVERLNMLEKTTKEAPKEELKTKNTKK